MRDWKEYERNVAKALGDWWGCPFRRTPSSGAWSTMSARMGSTTGNDFHGDIVAPPEAKFPFSVECKAYATIDLYLAMYGEPIVPRWWEQCLADAQRVKKWPMLVMKGNSKKPLIVLSSKLWDKLEPKLALTMYGRLDAPMATMRFDWNNQGVRRSVVIMGLAQFLTACPARILKS